MGFEADDLLSIFDTLREEDIWQYRYPDDADLKQVGVRGIYLGNFVRWDPKAQHEQMIRDYDYRSATFSRTFDTYDFVDCFNYLDLHDLLKLYKHGYSKVTDHASREIRFGRLSRDQGLNLVKRFELNPLKYQDLFCEWLGVTPRSLHFLIDQHRNPLFWQETEPGNWDFKGWSTYGHPSVLEPTEIKESGLFQANDSLEYTQEKKYITIGKGWP
jgi:hypothetical protein